MCIEHGIPTLCLGLYEFLYRLIPSTLVPLDSQIMVV